jgi:hypothetical protein
VGKRSIIGGVYMEERKTIKEWEPIFNVEIYDPDGFDRTDPELYNRKFTKAEFEQGMLMSTCISK